VVIKPINSPIKAEVFFGFYIYKSCAIYDMIIAMQQGLKVEFIQINYRSLKEPL